MSNGGQEPDRHVADSEGPADASDVTAVLEAFLADLQAGKPTDAEQVLAEHPDLSEKLTGCLRVVQSLQRMQPSNWLPPKQDLDPSRPSAQGSGTRQVGEYHLVREIGCGGMGLVYEAEQPVLGRRVALKILPFASLLNPSQLQRFQHEARIAATLNHPHIVPIYSVGSDRGVEFFVMQLIQGCSVAWLLAKLRKVESDRPKGDRRNLNVSSTRAPTRTMCSMGEQLEQASDEVLDCDRSTDSYWEEIRETGARPLLTAWNAGDHTSYFRKVAQLGIQAAEAIQYAHEQGVVHRDIKPGNLLIDRQEHLWIADFGLSRLTSEATATATGEFVGTLRYMTPEQVRSGHAVVDPRGDVYALGATLYELLTLSPVATGSDRNDILNRIANETPTAPRHIDTAIPADLETIILKAVEKDVEQRYASARALASDLRCFLESRPIQARRPSVIDRLAKWAQRHKRLVAGATATVLLLTVILAVSTVLVSQARHRTRESLSRVRDVLYVRDMSLAYEAWEQSWTDRAQTILRRQRPAPGIADRRGFEWYLLDQLVKQSPPVVMRGHQGAVNEVSVFPDQRRLASVGDDGTVRIWNLADGQLMSQISADSESLAAVAVSPDGEWLVAGNHTISLWDVAQGRKVRDLTSHKTTVESLAFSPDGTLVASGARYEDVQVVSLQGVVKLQLQTGARNESLSFSPDGRRLAVPFRKIRQGTTIEVVRVLDIETGQVVLDVEYAERGELPSLTLAEFSKDGASLVVGSRRGSFVAVMHPTTGEPLLVSPKQRDQLNAIATSQDSMKLGAACNDGVVTCWTISDGILRHDRSIRAQAGPASHLQFVNDQKLATSGADGTINLWRLESLEKTVSLGPRDQFLLTDLDVAPDESQLAIVDSNRQIWLGDLQGTKGTVLRLPAGPSNWYQRAAYSPRGDCVAVSCENWNQLTLLDPKQKRIIGVLEADALGFHDVQFSPTGDFLIGTGNDAKLHIWQLAQRREVQHVDLPHHGWCAVFSRDGEVLATGGRFPDIVICDTANWQIVRKLSAKSPTEDLAFSPDGQILASAHSDAQIRLWDTKTWRLLATLAGHDGSVSSVSFSPDGKTLASASSDGTVRLWSVLLQCEYGIVLRNRSLVTVTFAPEGQKLFVGFRFLSPDHERNVLMWDVEQKPEK